MDSTLLDAILIGVPMPVVVIGTDSRIVAANPPGVAIIGPNGIGRLHAIALRQPDVLTAIDGALRDGTGGQAQFIVHGPSHQVTYLVTVTPLAGLAADTRGHAAICAFQDTTEQQLIGQFRRDFVANVSHELRTPLTALMGFIETLKGAAKNDPAAQDRFLTIMEREAGRMNRLVRDLLSLSKVEAEERLRPITTTDITERIKSAVTTLRPMISQARVTVEILGGKDSPQVAADPDQMQQVFQNLIENAVKYGGPGKLVTVDIQTPQDGGLLRIDVIDRGDGIAAHHLPRLTERFYRVDRHRSREDGGTGLGLAIVKHIINRHRGKLSITSTRGQGSCVSVWLPFA